MGTCIDCGRKQVLDFWRERCSRCYYRFMHASRRHKTRRCILCNEMFTTTRRDAKYSSPGCRLKAFRRNAPSVRSRGAA